MKHGSREQPLLKWVYKNVASQGTRFRCVALRYSKISKIESISLGV